MAQLSDADGVLPYEVRIPVHPSRCVCPQSPGCRGKAVGPQVPGFHPRRNLPATSMQQLLEDVEELVREGPQGEPSKERQAAIERAERDGAAPRTDWGSKP